MVKRCSLLMFFSFLLFYIRCYGQSDSISTWQEQVLASINPDDFSDVSYARLMEMLSDLEQSRRDTIFPTRIRQNLILSGGGCLRPQPAKGYLGDASNQTIRYKIQVNEDWKAGVVLNKDAGEPLQRHVPFYDSYSAYIKHRNTIVGHYRIRFGSGLILNQQFSMGKNIIGDSFMSSGTKVSPHSSTDEYNYMQGIATTLQLRRVQVLPFVSFKQIDAAVTNDTITSIPEDGYHRSANERRKRNAATVFNAGLHVSTRTDWVEVGTSLLYTRFSHPFFRPLRAYNIYYYRGEQLLQGSVDYHARRFGFELRGETAIDQKLNFATIMQLSRKLGEDWRASLLYRRFGRKYQQLYGTTLSEGSGLQGEQGAMLNLSGEPFPHWRLLVMFDYFCFSNTQYPTLAPYSGFELRTQASYSHKTINTNVSYRLKSKNAWRHSLDCDFSYTFPIGLKLKTQIRSKFYSTKEVGFRSGYALAQAVSYENSRFVVELQTAWFDAQDYNARIYLNEKNILYGFSFPMLYGRGFRSTLTCTCRFCQHIAFDLKFCTDKLKLLGQMRVKF